MLKIRLTITRWNSGEAIEEIGWYQRVSGFSNKKMSVFWLLPRISWREFLYGGILIRKIKKASKCRKYRNLGYNLKFRLK